MSTTTEQRVAELEASAVVWDAAAIDQEALAANPVGGACPDVCANKAVMSRRAAEALRLQIRTGAAHCVCCLKPLGGAQ